MATLELDGTLIAEKDNNNKIISHVDQLSEATSGGGIQFNSATILQKVASNPANPVEGQIYYNTTNGIVKHWNGTEWLEMSNKFSATGGTVTTYVLNNVSYKSHTFLTSGTFSVIEGQRNLQIMIVPGGGGGSQDTAGGGGAGGVYIVNSVASIGDYTISVGGGGARAYTSQGYNGQNSSAFGFTAIGGGGGAGSAASNAAGSGGSGGGGGASKGAGSGTPGQGNNGESSSGAAGGGGAGQVGGTNGTGTGGDGVINNFRDGTNQYYGGGGGGFGIGISYAGGLGGGGGNSTSFGNSLLFGVDNTGGGGGAYGGSWGGAGDGGSGIVIIRYQI